jgi:hypothetical protein
MNTRYIAYSLLILFLAPSLVAMHGHRDALKIILSTVTNNSDHKLKILGLGDMSAGDLKQFVKVMEPHDTQLLQAGLAMTWSDGACMRISQAEHEAIRDTDPLIFFDLMPNLAKQCKEILLVAWSPESHTASNAQIEKKLPLRSGLKAVTINLTLEGPGIKIADFALKGE